MNNTLHRSQPAINDQLAKRSTRYTYHNSLVSQLAKLIGQSCRCLAIWLYTQKWQTAKSLISTCYQKLPTLYQEYANSLSRNNPRIHHIFYESNDITKPRATQDVYDLSNKESTNKTPRKTLYEIKMGEKPLI